MHAGDPPQRRSNGHGGSLEAARYHSGAAQLFDHREKYVVTMVNGVPVTNRDHEKLGGATSEGEFGSMLYDIFNPATEAAFHWEKWATWRGHRMHVYSFEVRAGPVALRHLSRTFGPARGFGI